jgi:hypothetical protein
MDISDKKIITHKFNNWDEIPDVKHLQKVKNNYVNVFESKCREGYERFVTYISYAIENDIIVAFGSASYYNEGNYYGKNATRQLWIEGLVSISKGCGTLVLQELEKVLTNIANEYNVEYRIINIMAVSDSIGFYENNDYIECRTSSYWLGVGDCTRLAKPIDNFNMESAKILIYDIIEADYICNFIINGRRNHLAKYINIPRNIKYTEIKNYVIENGNNNIFTEIITSDMREKILYFLINEYD